MSTENELIAICGMSFRLPGGLNTSKQFWDFLVEKGDARQRVPKSRYNIDAYYSLSGEPGTIKTKHGYFLDEKVNLGHLDTSYFQFSKSQACNMDPQQRLLLEVAREALEDAGEKNWRGSRTGCYIGNFGEDWLETCAKDDLRTEQYGIEGTGDFVLSNRVSYQLDLRGPSVTVRTACSSALTALHEACEAVANRDCDSAIVGGTSLILAPSMTASMSEQGVLAPDGSCKTFSADANGYARGEAINAIYIKPLASAIRDGNPIRAVIRSTAANSDGKGRGGISAPSSEAQEALIRRAYDVAGIEDYSKTAFVECHGTGTTVGDSIEIRALAKTFGPSGGVYITSVKPNLGHSEGASGLTSVIKAILALENQVIPPNIKFSELHRNAELDTTNLKVPTEPIPWPKSCDERVSISSFGIGGSNAHAILESARSFDIPIINPTVASDAPQLLVLSASSRQSLEDMGNNYKSFLDENPDSIDDLAYTLGNRREHLPFRSFAVMSRYAPFRPSPATKRKEDSHLVMMFTGQGAQWPLMGKELLQESQYPVFRRSIQCLDEHVQALEPGWSILEELLQSPHESRLDEAEISQPLCTAIQIALVDTLSSIGITPAAVVGHSSGELAAAYAARALTAKEAIIAAFYRGVAAGKQTKMGAMAAVGLALERVEQFLIPGVVIACENSPESVTISGDVEAVRTVVHKIKDSEPDVLARVLRVDKAYHSHHMTEIGDDYHALITKDVVGQTPKKLFFSSVTGALLEGSALGPDYWQKNLESRVSFRSAVKNLLNHEIGENATFIEIGPHSALSGPLRQIQDECRSSNLYIPSMLRNQDSVESFLVAVGQLYVSHIPMDLEQLLPRGRSLPDLPRYPWSYSDTYWLESRLSKEWRHRQHRYHELLGVRVRESTEIEPLWRNLFNLEHAPWIRDHKVKNDIVFPFAGYVGMIGEAVRQISGIEEAFVMRRVVVSTALVLAEAKPMEIITALRRHQLTDSLESRWWDFTISSHNGHSWMTHCTGLTEKLIERPPITMPLRKITSERCYAAMQKQGLNFGPSFQCLHDIRSETSIRLATAMAATKGADQNGYHLPPTIIDAALQLMSVAATKGYVGDYTEKTIVPVRVDKLSVYRCTVNVPNDFQIVAQANFTSAGDVVGETRCNSTEGMLLEVDGLRLKAIEDVDEHENDVSACRTEWVPDTDFVDVSLLMKEAADESGADKLNQEHLELVLESSERQLRGLKSDLPHMQKFATWISSQLKEKNSSNFAHLSDRELLQRIESITERLHDCSSGNTAQTTAVNTILNNIKDLFLGTVQPLDILQDDDTLRTMYQTGPLDITELCRCLVYSKPGLRILEIGGNTGHVLSSTLSALFSPTGQPLFSEYVFTDVSDSMVAAAEIKFQKYSRIEYMVLDISQNPSSQGFEGRHFDLVIAGNVLHHTESVFESLKNIRMLLRADGRLLLRELCSTTLKVANYVFGSLPGWWISQADDSLKRPYVTPNRWISELQSSGFESSRSIDSDHQELYQQSSRITVKPTTNSSIRKRVTILCHAPTHAESLNQKLQERGYQVDCCYVGDCVIPKDQDIIAILDKDESFFHDMDSHHLKYFQRLINNIGNKGIFWVTHLCQMQCRVPDFAQINGIARTLRKELFVDFATCEVDTVDSSWDVVVDVFSRFQTQLGQDQPRKELEYAILDRKVYVPRLFPCSLKKELQVSDLDDRFVFRTSCPGQLNNLHWTRAISESLENDSVEVEIYTAGLNFRDLMVAEGIVESSQLEFGSEAAGIVRGLGPSVKDNLKIGDRVMLTCSAAFASRIAISEQRCVKIPDELSFEDAATMPCVYMTAIYSLFDIGGLQGGQSVLIHSACGGVGIASIQLAKMVGAEIYATVGNEDKVEYLMQTFGLPRRRIFNSRDVSFLDDLMRETSGKGVDLALNSLSGELLHATWNCVAAFGKLVEIGKRDILGGARLDMRQFLENRSYCCVDLDQLGFLRPQTCKSLLERTIQYFKSSRILPIRPIKVMPASSIPDAFRYMRKGQHMGKIVISIRDASGETNIGTKVSDRQRDICLDRGASYLLVGGLGGLGQSVSRWMIERGARKLIYLSRSANDEYKYQEFVQELQAMGCDVQLIQGSVSNAKDVTKAVQAAKGNLKGVLQMSMVLCDREFGNMTIEDWTAAVDPKIKGTWNLHNATISAGAVLDFFVLFSSLSGTLGVPGQTNYAGANTFLDAFVQYRLDLGLCASVMDIGPVEEVGYISQRPSLLRSLIRSGMNHHLSEKDLLEALAVSITASPIITPKAKDSPCRIVIHNSFALGVNPKSFKVAGSENETLRNDIRWSFVAESDTSDSTATATNVLQQFIAETRHDVKRLKQPESLELITTEIGKQVYRCLLQPEEDLDTSRFLSDLGLDSLVTIELARWWRHTFKFSISVLEITSQATIDGLGAYAVEGLCSQNVEV
ncbi:ketoacyl-synt-domain-containing protein [Pseudovirgaria hyperparasitica]|uniref:Ketoacyl-synt-domain-containing protein n=1 Tax=Pseudovirgaria hyperparasitica TaxID=470096 RepID=A0A6A6W4U2_9PEZI|nr:ketoacyl-synt-domain-containing protein [Pseudovirgaria hyperparasitica]KAF2756071.1 ketoacyl-synt-domain-containing protein [Pseudovirgaria hyperparasitica]